MPGESLFHHTWLVLARLAELRRLRPDLALAGAPDLWTVLYWAGFLHDFGKAAAGFQRSLHGGRRWPFRHEVLSLAFIDWLDNCLNEEEQTWLAAAILFHHRDLPEISGLYSIMDGSADDPLFALTEEVTPGTVVALQRWLTEYAALWRVELGFDAPAGQAAVAWDFSPTAAFLSSLPDRVRRRLGRVLRWCRQMRDPAQPAQRRIGAILLRGHLQIGDHSASAHIKPPATPIRDPASLLARLHIDTAALYPHQRAAMHTIGSAVLMAPTGSGKTEAALLWACAQGMPRAVPRLLYCLPFQASMNAMYDRLNQAAFPGAVGLEHARSTLALYRRLVDEQAEPEKAVRLAKWEKNLAHLHHYPVRVLSPYQLLKGPYRLKGYEILLTDCRGAAVILDEIHAYEPGRLGQILALVQYLRQHYDARFLLMSATLPAVVHNKLCGVLGEYTLIKAAPAVYAAFRRHKVFPAAGDMLDEAGVAAIAARAARGGSILVCCNTVKRARQMYAELKTRLAGRGAEIMLLHARFNSRDRLLKERHLRDAAGTNAAARRPVILVATQVVEVSLDVDFDTIYTDPAPLEALLQRFGRVNRGRRQPWAPVHVFTQPLDTVYDRVLVERALQVMSARAGEFIEEEKIDDYLAAIYQPDVTEKWEREYWRTYREFADVCLAELRPFAADGDLEKLFYQAFDSIDVLPAQYAQEYRRLVQDNLPLPAQELLVPMSWRQYLACRRQGLSPEHDAAMPPLVDMSYDEETGLHV